MVRNPTLDGPEHHGCRVSAVSLEMPSHQAGVGQLVVVDEEEQATTGTFGRGVASGRGTRLRR